MPAKAASNACSRCAAPGIPTNLSKVSSTTKPVIIRNGCSAHFSLTAGCTTKPCQYCPCRFRLRRSPSSAASAPHSTGESPASAFLRVTRVIFLDFSHRPSLRGRRLCARLAANAGEQHRFVGERSRRIHDRAPDPDFVLGQGRPDTQSLGDELLLAPRPALVRAGQRTRWCVPVGDCSAVFYVAHFIAGWTRHHQPQGAFDHARSAQCHPPKSCENLICQTLGRMDQASLAFFGGDRTHACNRWVFLTLGHLIVGGTCGTCGHR